MNEWLKRIVQQLKTLWQKITTTQKILIFSVAGVAIFAVILLFVFSAAPSRPPLFRTAITDESLLSRITRRLDQENVHYTVDNNVVYMDDERTAMRMRSILVREDLLPDKIDPWTIFDVERWTITDFERDVNLQRALEEKLRQHILALEDIDAVSLSLSLPKPATFQEDQEPKMVSVAITAKPGSDITENRKKIEGIEKLIRFAVPGLEAKNIAIIDQVTGEQINDFDTELVRKMDELNIIERELDIKADLEAKYKREIYRGLSKLYTPDRVEILKIEIDLDMRKRITDAEEHTPITLIPDNPRTPYDETKVVEYITRKKLIEAEDFEGTGFTPEGPPGVEGQVPPAYKDLSNLVGKYKRNLENLENAINTRKIHQEDRPWDIKRLSIGVAVDGKWQKQYDPATGELMIDDQGRIQRSYIPVSEEQLETARRLLQAAVGYSPERNDQVTVVHHPIDRSAEFEEEDAVVRQQIQVQRIIFWVIIGLGLVFVAIIAFRLLSKYLERRRRLKEEELARQHQAMREAALRSAEEKGVDVELSVEERARLEMQENAINMAREHPEDVAQLIRTWLLEE
ncbi:MAG TPA: flagellar M-ring protein FliF [Spirochaetia bacterium]|nr:flagellar M-ring protein FliF [Spirochaetia bacterium]